MVLPPDQTERFYRIWIALLHYVNARLHRALRLRPPMPGGHPVAPDGPVVRFDRRGGVLHEHTRRAA